MESRAPRARLNLRDLYRLARNDIQIDGSEMTLALRNECAKLPNNFAGAVIAAPDVADNITQLLEVRRLRAEDQFGRFGVVPDGDERLVQFVGDRNRHFAGSGVATDQSKLGHPLPGRFFGDAPFFAFK